MTGNIESTGYIDGVWHAPKDTTILALITHNPAYQGMMDEKFPEFGRIDDSTMYYENFRFLESVDKDIHKRAAEAKAAISIMPCSLESLNKRLTEGPVRLQERPVSQKLKKLGFSVIEPPSNRLRDALNKTFPNNVHWDSPSEFHVFCDAGDEEAALHINGVVYRLITHDGDFTVAKMPFELPKVENGVPMPPVKKPKLDYVNCAGISPDLLQDSTPADWWYRANTKVVQITITGDSVVDKGEILKGLKQVYPKGKPGYKENTFVIYINESYSPQPVDIEELVNAADALNKELDCDLEVVVFDPTKILVQPIQPGLRIVKNEKEITNHTVFMTVECPGIYRDTATFGKIVAYCQGTVISKDSFKVHVGAEPSNDLLRSKLGEVSYFMEECGIKTWGYQLRQEHLNDLVVPISKDDKEPKLVCTLSDEPPRRMRMRLERAFPVSLNWKSKTVFEIACGKDPQTAKQVASAVYALVTDDSVNPRDVKRIDKEAFLSDPGSGRIPPRPGSEQSSNEVAVKTAIHEGRKVTVEEAIKVLEQEIEQRDIDPENRDDLKKDKAIMALGALQQVRDNNRKKVVRGRFKLVGFLLAMLLAGFLIYKYEWLLFERGSSTTFSECSVVYGDGRLTGKRYITREYRELFGIRVINSADAHVVTKLDLPGDQITILGINPKNDKWWRKNFVKGDMGQEPLKPSEQYWFVGPKHTATVSSSNFCTKG